MAQTFLWHDYETFGVNTKKTRPSQFAGIRTDENLNIIEEGINIFCQPTNDFIPNPMACKVTGVTPKMAMEKGLPEHEFMEKILSEMTKPGTCNVGYNSIAFDDEITRFGLYRNLLPIYDREWKNNCSRWDIVNMVRMCYLTHPETLNWPKDEDTGKVRFKLDMLCPANGIEHMDAHDALSDVKATIELAKIIKEKQPKLFEHFFNLRKKQMVINTLTRNPTVLHSDFLYGSDNEYFSIAQAIPLQEGNKPREYLMISLDKQDLNDIVNLDEESIKTRLFEKKDVLEENNLQRIISPKLAVNKSPAIAPVSVLDKNKLTDEMKERVIKNKEILVNNTNFVKILKKAYNEHEFPKEENADVETLLYDGFISNKDSAILSQIRQNFDFSQEQHFEDKKLHDLVFSFKAKHFPELMNEMELEKWEEKRIDKIKNKSEITIENFIEELSNLLESNDKKIVNDLYDHVYKIGDDEIKNQLKEFKKSFLKKRQKNKP